MRSARAVRRSLQTVARVITLAAGAALVMSTPAFATTAYAQASAQPVATASEGTARLGDLVRVKGSNWGAQGGDVVNVVVCGNDALDGDVDCDLSNTAEGAIRVGGDFNAAITITAPPVPCPCVLRFNRHLGDMAVNLPIRLFGFAVAPPVAHPPPTRATRVTDMHVTGDDPWTAWFGGVPRRTLHFTITNTGAVAVQDPPVQITWGRGADPTGFIQPPSIGTIEPGQVENVAVRIPFGMVPIGVYSVRVQVDVVGAESGGRASTTVIPWGWILVLVVLLQVLLLKGRNAMRRRLAPAGTDQAIDDSVPSGQGNDELLVGSGSLEMTPAHPVPEGTGARSRPGVRTLAVLITAGAIASCQGSSGNGSTAAQNAAQANHCSLTSAEASTVLGATGSISHPAPIAGLPTPLQRCQYDAHGRSLQLTAFPGSAVFTKFSTITAGGGVAAPELGAGGYCTDGRGPSSASVACFFLSRGNTYILGLDLPVKEDGATVVTRVREVAAKVKVAADGAAS